MALTFREVKSYSDKVKSVIGKAESDLASQIASSGGDSSRVMYRLRSLADKYGAPMQELGAQWYEFCAQKAGVDVENAIIGELDYGDLESRAESILEDYADGDITWEQAQASIGDAFGEALRGYERDVINSNLDRDARQERRRYRQTDRAAAKAGWCRVPVGETCAWCLMLASLGYYYRSKETALGIEPDHYHAHCDCIAVPYNGPEAIEGYDDYEMYFDMYATARDTYNDGTYSPELSNRIEAAREKHEADYRAGRTNTRWTDTNAIMMIMREQQGLEH